MRSIVGVVLVAIGLMLVGCQSSGSKNAAAQTPAKPTSLPANDGLRATPTARNDKVKGLLAGQVVDYYNRRGRAEAEIEVVDLEESSDKKAAPLDVVTDSQGYFTIQGLVVGHNYRLIARSKDGDTVLSGTTFAVATNSRLSIFVREDSSAPPPKPREKPAPPDKKTDTSTENNNPTASIGAPVRSPQPDGASTNNGAATPINKSQIADERKHDFNSVPKAVPLNVPGKDPQTNVPENPDRSPETLPPTPGSPRGGNAPKNPMSSEPNSSDPPPGSLTGRTGKVPACVVLASQLQRLTVNDLSGETWDYERDLRDGTRPKLVLLFFADYGKPESLGVINPIKDLQSEFQKQGLEVVSVAYDLTDFKDPAATARAARSRYGIKYRIGLGDGSLETCPIAKSFQLSKAPTVYLLGEDGRIIGNPFTTLDDAEFKILRHEIDSLLYRKQK